MTLSRPHPRAIPRAPGRQKVPEPRRSGPARGRAAVARRASVTPGASCTLFQCLPDSPGKGRTPAIHWTGGKAGSARLSHLAQSHADHRPGQEENQPAGLSPPQKPTPWPKPVFFQTMPDSVKPQLAAGRGMTPEAVLDSRSLSLPTGGWGQAPAPDSPQTLPGRLPANSSGGSPPSLLSSPLPRACLEDGGDQRDKDIKTRVWTCPSPCESPELAALHQCPPTPSHTPQASSVSTQASPPRPPGQLGVVKSGQPSVSRRPALPLPSSAPLGKWFGLVGLVTDQTEIVAANP